MKMDSSSIEEEDPNIFEKILRGAFHDPCLTVDKLSCANGCAVGYNLLSDLKRVTVTGKCSDEKCIQRGAVICYFAHELDNRIDFTHHLRISNGV